jgi:SagB-type dehydrogenase family enzyme
MKKGGTMFLLISILLFAHEEQGGGVIKLPEPEFTNKSIEECIQVRRSIREFKNKALTLNEIANLLWAAQGITDKEKGFRAAPSAGATYPLVLFIATQDGIFQYIPQSHALRRKNKKDLRTDIAKAALNQMFIADAGLVIIITALFENTTWRYGERGVRYVHNEVGHCAQNIHLEAVALGLGSVPVGAFYDDKVKDILDLDKEEPIYIIPVGYPLKPHPYSPP